VKVSVRADESFPVWPIQSAKASPRARTPAKLTRHHGGALGSGMDTRETNPRSVPSALRIRSAAHAMKAGSIGTVASWIILPTSRLISHHWQTLIRRFPGGGAELPSPAFVRYLLR